MIDIVGTQLTTNECDNLSDPRVGGLILFSRNFQSVEQVKVLIKEARKAAGGKLLVAVDHEGGRVQRFRDGFTAIPPMRDLGKLFESSPEQALRAGTTLGGVLAAELADLDVDFSFAPVLDIDTGNSSVIGDRAFHHTPDIVSVLAEAVIQGLHNAGMAAVGKHFPGHGFVAADSHLELPIDHRDLDAIRQHDLIPFARLAKSGMEGVMPAHVVYEKLDLLPAGFSPFWIQTILRKEIGFNGAVFSDDLSMQGAVSSGSPVARARLALTAGCDMLLVCNDPTAVNEILGELDVEPDQAGSVRLEKLVRKKNSETERYCQIVADDLADVLESLA